MISVILISYNHEDYISERLASIIGQNNHLISELIIYDDGSTDKTPDIIARFSWHGFPVIKRLRDKIVNSPFNAWSEIIKTTTGSLIWVAEGDDSCSFDLLDKLVVPFGDPKIVLAYCDSKIIDETGKILAEKEHWSKLVDPEHWENGFVEEGADEWEKFWRYRNSAVNASGVLFRKSAFNAISFLPIGWRACGDWIIWGQIARMGKVAYINESLNHWRQHPNSTRSARFDKDLIRLKETVKAVRFWQNLAKNEHVRTDWKKYDWIMEWWLSRYSYANLFNPAYFGVSFPLLLRLRFYILLARRTAKEIMVSLKKI